MSMYRVQADVGQAMRVHAVRLQRRAIEKFQRSAVAANQIRDQGQRLRPNSRIEAGGVNTGNGRNEAIAVAHKLGTMKLLKLGIVKLLTANYDAVPSLPMATDECALRRLNPSAATSAQPAIRGGANARLP